MVNKIAVISDIHGNADSLEYVLKDLKRDPVDLTIFLGDLLTYGVQPNKVIDLILSYKMVNDSIFIKGNHDQFYFDIQKNITEETYKIPVFVKECIKWTANEIGDNQLESSFDWLDNFITSGIYFAHANPYEYGDWQYVEKIDAVTDAFHELKRKQCSIGIFGHSHRQKFFELSNNNIAIKKPESCADLHPGRSYIINAGSIGQPRGNGFCYLRLDLNINYNTVTFIPFDVDIRNSIYLIEQTSLSVQTQEKLVSYLRS